MKKWLTYLNERFPLQTHIPIIGMFTASAIGYSMLASNTLHWDWLNYLVAFIFTLSIFFLLRISDEHKDYEDDMKYRSYLPVARGFIQLKELRNIAIGVFLIHIGLLIAFPHFLIPYLTAIAFLFLMHNEFFISTFLKNNMLLYVISHMLIIPLVDLVASSAHWGAQGIPPPFALLYFFLVSFFNGIVLEIGRKIKPKNYEEEGVVSYTYLLGQQKAIYTWLGLLITTFCIAVFASLQIKSSLIIIGLQSIALIGCSIPAFKYLQQPTQKTAKWIENCSGIWTLLMYFSLGVLPFLLK